MSLDKTVRCGICGAPYKFYAFSAADQSACPSCVQEAERNMTAPSDRIIDEQRIRRAKYFGEWHRSLWMGDS